MSTTRLLIMLLLFGLGLVISRPSGAQIVADHTRTDITAISEADVLRAKQQLVIAYGHTSHGSQLTDGMTGLVGFMNGLGHPQDLYAWNGTGVDGALQLRNQPFSGASDLGNPDRTAWAAATRSYLDAHPEVNVIIWSWCGQVDGSEADIETYLGLMQGLEDDYPDVMFAYMTGHLDGTGESGNVHLRNEQIRAFCTANGKILYDFADIESFDPDGLTNYMALLCDDGCGYDSDGNGSRDRNWATDWQDSHTQDVDWYSCGSAHSQPLNANRKAYAAWWLWAELGKLAEPHPDTTPPDVPGNLRTTAVAAARVDLAWDASSDAESGISHYQVFRDEVRIGTPGGAVFVDDTAVPGMTCDYEVSAVNGAGLDSGRCAPLEVVTDPDGEAPGVPANLTAQAVSSTEIDLAWDPASDNTGVTGYRIYQDGGFLREVSGTSVRDTGLAADTPYSYRVAAVDAAANESALSDPATATTLPVSQEIHTLTIDNSSAGAIDDAFLDESAPTTNHGGTTWVSVMDRFVVSFDLPPELDDRRIVGAAVSFYVWNQTGYQPEQYLDLYAVPGDWSEAEVTWLEATAGNPWTAPGGDAGDLLGRILHLPDQADWDHAYYPGVDITGQVQRWASGADVNFGMLLVNDSLTDIGLKASEYSHGPRLVVRYTEENGPCYYETWCREHFTAGELADPALKVALWGRDADPDRDGRSNRTEHAFGGDPRVCDRGGGCVISGEGCTDGEFGFSYVRRSSAGGLSFRIEESADLATWTAVDAGCCSGESVVALDAGLERVSVTLAPSGGPVAGFFRACAVED